MLAVLALSKAASAVVLAVLALAKDASAVTLAVLALSKAACVKVSVVLDLSKRLVPLTVTLPNVSRSATKVAVENADTLTVEVGNSVPSVSNLYLPSVASRNKAV